MRVLALPGSLRRGERPPAIARSSKIRSNGIPYGELVKEVRMHDHIGLKVCGRGPGRVDRVSLQAQQRWVRHTRIARRQSERNITTQSFAAELD